MHDNIDLLGTLLRVLEGYILLDATMVVQVSIGSLGVEYVADMEFQLHGVALFDVLKKIITSFNVKDVLAASDLLFQLADVSTWPGPLHTSEYFWDLLKNVIQDKVFFSTDRCASRVSNPCDRSMQAFSPTIYASFRALYSRTRMCLFSLSPRVLQLTRLLRAHCLKECSTSGGTR
jgi:hypothetical protein